MSLNFELILTIIGTISSVAALIWAIFEFVIPHLKNLRELRKIDEKNNMGPYTINIIEEATRYYIRPKCSKNDPTHTYNQVYNTPQGLDLFNEADNFIREEESKKFLLILADSGMGKTSFILNFYSNNKRLPLQKRHKIKLVSLSIQNAESYILDEKINCEDTVIFLDAFDEDIKAINNYKERMLQLFRLCFRYKKVIITSRSQFFLKESDIPKETNISRIGPTNAGSQKQYEIQRLYLLPFSDDDIKKYIKKRYPRLNQEKKELAIQAISRIPSLSMRPMLLAYIPELLVSTTAANNTFSLFEIMIEGWLERESVWVDEQLLQEFSEKLSVDIYQNRAVRGTESVTKEELIDLSNKWKLKIENWKLTGRSLLNRDANDSYKFAHRSIMEFLFVKRLLKMDPDCYWVELTDQMTIFIGEYLKWSEKTKHLLGNKIKFLSTDLFWKIIDMRQGLSDEKYLEFAQIFDGIKFLELTGILLSRLQNQQNAKLLNIGNIGKKFDEIIEKENFGILSMNKYFSEPPKFSIYTSKNPSEKLFKEVAKQLGRQLKVNENIIKGALLLLQRKVESKKQGNLR